MIHYFNDKQADWTNRLIFWWQVNIFNDKNQNKIFAQATETDYFDVSSISKCDLLHQDIQVGRKFTWVIVNSRSLHGTFWKPSQK